MNKFEYKDFNIYDYNGRFCAQNKNNAIFKPDGYATLAAAKVAISKYVLNAQSEADKDKADATLASIGHKDAKSFADDVIEQGRKRMLPPARQGRKPTPSRNKREGQYQGRNGKHVHRAVEVKQPVASISAWMINFFRETA